VRARAESSVLRTTCASHGLIHVYELSVPALLLLIQSEFGAGDFRMGGVAALYAMLFGLGALPAGALADRIGPKRLLLACLWGGSVGMLGMALAPSLGWFAASAAWMGLALSIYHPAGTALLTHAIPASGRVFALHGMAGNSGVACASLIAGTLGWLVGWRWALGLLALAGFVLGLRVLALAVPELHEIRAREGRGEWRAFLMLLLATMCMGMVYRGIATFLPKFLALTYASSSRLGTAIGGGLTTAALLVGLGGMWLSGRAIDRGTHPARGFLIGALAQAPFLVAIAFVPSALVLPLFMGVAFFHFFTQPAGNHMVADFTPPRLRGLGYGLYFLMTFGVGALGASIGGFVSERWGLAWTFPALALLLAPCVATTALLERHVTSQVRKPRESR
jgi:MFS family permease